MKTKNVIPGHLRRDKYWGSLSHLFLNHSKLQNCLSDKYFDMREERIKIQSLQRESQVWSSSEKFMLKLALHLFDDKNKVNLSDMDLLDDYNKK